MIVPEGPNIEPWPLTPALAAAFVLATVTVLSVKRNTVAPWMRQFGLFLSVWLVVTFVLFSMFAVMSPLLYRVTSYAGFLLAFEYSTPQRPRWNRRLRWATILGFIAFLAQVFVWVQQSVLAGAT